MKFRSMARRADLVIAGNDYLRDQTAPFCDRVEVLPTTVDLERYRLKPTPTRNGSPSAGSAAVPP
jgi:hypothetical protein